MVGHSPSVRDDFETALCLPESKGVGDLSMAAGKPAAAGCLPLLYTLVLLCDMS